MNKYLAKPIIAAALLGFTQFASAIPIPTPTLSDLFVGGTLTSGSGIIFSDFTRNISDVDGSLIAVMAGANGLMFQATDGQSPILSLETDEDVESIQLWFSYKATAATGNTIVGQSMTAVLGHSGCDASRSPDPAPGAADYCTNQAEEIGYTQVWKELLDSTGNTSLGEIILTAGNTSSTPGPASAIGTSLLVDDFLEISNDYWEAGYITSFVQTFTQRENQVPVPATLALFGLGLLGIRWSRRKA